VANRPLRLYLIFDHAFKSSGGMALFIDTKRTRRVSF
jgi:hypothetical protein